MSELGTCIRQLAGPLVKECRYRRPMLAKGDLPSVRREKNEIQNLIRNSSFRRTPVDRLELMLALMLQYTLPAPFIIPLFVDMGEDGEYVSTTLSLGTLLTVVLFPLVAAFSLM